MNMSVNLIIAGSVGLLLFIYFYNRLVSAKQNAHEAWSGIDVQLTRRHDLIPSLVTVVKGYARHEEKLFQHIADVRSKALSVSQTDIKELAALEQEIASGLRSILAIAESYPQLRANEHFLKLQSQLTETEDQIASARRIYNSNVADYNSLIKTVPANIIAGVTNFSPLPFFQNT